MDAETVPPGRVASLWAQLCEIRGGRALKLTDARRRLVSGALRELSEDDALQIARWVAAGPGRAEYLRARGHDRPDTYLRACHRGAYLEMAQEWDGRPVAEVAVGVTPEQALEHMIRIRRDRGSQAEDRWHQDPHVSRAIHRACQRMRGGSREVAYADEYNRRRIHAEWMAAYREEVTR